jgi:outer membrane protein OmpA-like peptidoglycan-associated protein
MRGHLVCLGFLAAVGASGCSLVTVQQEPFPPLPIQADRPPPGPDRVVLTASSIQIADKVQFETGKAEILPESFALLDEVAEVFLDNEQITLVQVEGHTDKTGSASINKKLSQQRAESVRAYLIDKGVNKKRMVAKGFGPERPLAQGDDDASLEQNRRVEFNILKQGPKKTIVKDE